ncbi:MAG: SBBP repeat-containing protein [Bacteroidota bacterium]
MKGADGIDNDYISIQNFDFNHGHIQLQGAQQDYELIYCTQSEGCATEGYYLFYTKNGQADLIAFIFPCYDLGTTISGNSPQNPLVLCNSDSSLSLGDTTHFRFAAPISSIPTLPEGLVQFGTPGKEILGGITSDYKGNSYSFGCSDGSLDGGPRQGHEIFVVKHDPEGKRLWTYELTQPNGALLFDGITDSSHLFVAGRTLGALPGFQNQGRWDAIILKLDLETGQLAATDQFGNPGLDGYGNITFDDAGNLLLSGQGSPAGATGTDADYLIAKHRKSDLQNEWRVFNPPSANPVFVSEAWGGISYIPGGSPGDGAMIVAGWYMTRGGANSFITKYENLTQATPTQAASVNLVSPGNEADWVLDNTVDKDGNVYIAGYTTGNLQGTHLGKGDAFVAKYTSQLTNPQFVQFGTPESDNIRKLEIGEDGNLYVAGYTYGDWSGTNGDASRRTGDVLIAKLSSDLRILERQQIGTPLEDRGYIHLRDSILYVGGMTEASLVASNLGSFDGFVAKLQTKDLELIDQTSTALEIQNSTEIVSVYPVPTTGQLFISLENGAFPDKTTAELFDATGRNLTKYSLSGTTTQVEIPASSTGLMLLRIDFPNGPPVLRQIFVR